MNINKIKSIIKPFLPPIILDIYGKMINKKWLKVDFTNWWKDYQLKKMVPSELISMVNYYITTKQYEASSVYWKFLNKKNIEQLVDCGYENFKQTVARNYYTWVGNDSKIFSDKLFGKVEKLSIDIPFKDILRKHDFFTPEESIQFNIVSGLLLEFIRQNGGREYINKIEEPLEGNPPYITFQDKRITQDLLNSILDYLNISKGINLSKVNKFIELGAGYGRTAYCLIKILGNIKYIIVDIPPALYISQKYLSTIFSDKRTFKFRPFESFNEIEDEYNNSDLIFILPDQLSLLPAKSVDMFIAIDNLHAMKKNDVDYYFDQADRIADYFYFTCWPDMKTPFDNISYSLDNYPIKNNWERLFQESCIVTEFYVNSLYQIKKK